MLSECIKFLYCDVLQNSLLNDKDYMEQIHRENIAASNCYKLAPKSTINYWIDGQYVSMKRHLNLKSYHINLLIARRTQVKKTGSQ